MNCSFCGEPLSQVFADLGHQPPSNSFLTAAQLDEPEVTYPLKAMVCDKCFLVQVPEHKRAEEIFTEDYVYLSSQSPSNVSHARAFAAQMVERFGLSSESRVVEIGSNDGYLLKWFQYGGIQVMGYEPSLKAQRAAVSRGIKTIPMFFNKDTARYHETADLVCGINVLAHNPDINNFVLAVCIALKPTGVAVFEFPHLRSLIRFNQFDTIYQEHFYYFSLYSVMQVFQLNRLVIFDAEEIPEHGGSLRIYARHSIEGNEKATERLAEILGREMLEGVNTANYYSGFQYRINRAKTLLLKFLLRQKEYGKAVAGYGAAAKGNTLLNACGIKPDLLPYVVDVSPHKQGKYLPGSHIRVTDENELKELKPEFILILPWNLKTEIVNQLSYAREWGAKFVTAIPELGMF